MKNIYEILKDYGLEIPEEKKADFDKSWKENYRTKNEYDKAVNQRDEYKTSLDTVNGKLKEFDGVDVADLKGQITKLQDDLQRKQSVCLRIPSDLRSRKQAAEMQRRSWHCLTWMP